MLANRVRSLSALALVATLVTVALAPATVSAQSTIALAGSVADESGGLIVGATVTLTPTNGAAVRTVMTDSQGAFSVAGLASGDYVLSAERDLFTRATQVVHVETGRAPGPVAIVLYAGGLSEDVVVTATRTATETANLPAPVTVVSSETIAARNVTRLGDALTQVPGLYLQSPSFGQLYAGTGAGGFTFRGLNQSRTLVLLDGQPLQDAATSGVNFRVAFMPEVNRVEVVPGAFSSLYGSSAIGGVINIITKQPDRTGGTASVRQGFGDAASTQGDAYGQYRRGRLGFAGGAGYGNNRSYITEFVVRQPGTGAAGTAVTGAIPTVTREGVPSYIVGDKSRSPWKEKRGTAKASFNLTDTTRINGGVVYSDSVTQFTRFNSYLRDASGNEVSSGTLGINGQRVTLTESNFVTSAPLQEAATRVYGGLQTLINERLPLSVTVGRISRENNFNTVGTASTWNSGPGAHTTTPNANLDANAVLTLPVGRSLVVGGSYHQESMTRRNLALSNWRDKRSVTFTNNGSDGDTTVLSGFGQQEVALGNALTLYGGARVDHWSTEGSYFQNTNPVSTIAYAKRAVTSFSPKVSAVYRPVSPLTLRGSVGRSFRAPTNNDLYSTTIISASQSVTGFLTTQGNPDMQPEHGIGTEAGAEWRITPKHKVVATYYQTDLTDLIYSKNVSTALTERINAGEAQIKGLEVTAEARLAPWLTVSGFVTSVATQITRNDADATTVGKRLTNAPDHMAGLDAVVHLQKLTASVTVSYVGKAFALAGNTDTFTGVPSSADTYTVAHAKAGYRLLQGLAANLAINNLTNRDYYVFYRMPNRDATLELAWTF